MRCRDVHLRQHAVAVKAPTVDTRRDAVRLSKRPSINVSSPVILGGAWTQGAKSLISASSAGQTELVDAMEDAYCASTLTRDKHIERFEAYLNGRGCSVQLFKEYIEPWQRRVVQKTLDASSLATYSNYLAGKFCVLKGSKTMKAILAQGGHSGGTKRAPRLSPVHRKKLLTYVMSSPVTVAKAGMWMQIRMSAPRAADVARLLTHHFMPERHKAHWAFTKSIRKAADAKTCRSLGKCKPPFSLKWWQEQGRKHDDQPLQEYSSEMCNTIMREVCKCTEGTRRPTSTSLRLVFIDDAVEKAGGDYEA